MSYSETPFQEEFNALEERFADEVENVYSQYVGVDDDGNLTYEPEYTVEEREHNRVQILNDLSDMIRPIEGMMDDLYRLKNDIERFYDDVEQFDIEEDD